MIAKNEINYAYFLLLSCSATPDVKVTADFGTDTCGLLSGHRRKR